jgi:hypothetical protein
MAWKHKTKTDELSVEVRSLRLPEGLIYSFYSQCKRKLHNLTHDQILGQEVCHLLCKAQADKNKRQKEHYIVCLVQCALERGPANRWHKTFLLSWHHLQAYTSRLDVSDDYLDSLAFDSKHLKGRLSVKRTRVFNLKEPSERIQFASNTVEIILYLLGRFRSCNAIAIRLRDFEGD